MLKRNFGWGERPSRRSDKTTDAETGTPPASAVRERKRLALQPLEERLAPNVAWGE